MESGCFGDPASLVYFLTAVRLGAVQVNDIQPETNQSHYSSLELLLHSCSEARKPETISAHLLLATFCNTFSKKDEFAKHCRLAATLICGMECAVPERLKTALKFLMHGSQFSLFSNSDGEMQLLQFCMPQFSITPETFSTSFPLLTSLICHKYNRVENPQEPGKELPEMVVSCPMLCISLVTASWFETALSELQISKASAEAHCVEIRKFISLGCALAKMPIDKVPSSTQADVLHIDILLLLVQGEFEKAKIMLSSILKGTDFWALQTGYVLLGEVQAHRLHFLIAVAVFLTMDDIYSTFWDELALVFSFMHRDLLLPNCLTHFCTSNFQSLCNCKDFSAQCNILATVGFLQKNCANYSVEIAQPINDMRHVACEVTKQEG